MAFPEGIAPSNINMVVRPDASGAGTITYRYGEGHHEQNLTMEKVVPFFNNVVAETAALAWSAIHAKYPNNEVLEKADRESFSVDMDNQATDLMAIRFGQAEFGIKVLDSEGKKEERKYGIKLSSLDGSYGPATIQMVEGYVDPVEGTTAASSNEVGSVAIFGGSLDNGHSLVPPENGDAIYMDRIVAGPKLKGKINLEMEPSKIVSIAVEAYGLTSSSELKVVVLDRPRNADLIGMFEAAGANVIKIKAGDLMPALAALAEDEPMISMGSGGKTEGIIAGIGAKARGGFFEGQYVNTDGQLSKDHPKKLTLEDLFPGDASNYFVSLASITGTQEYGLDLPPVKRYENGEVVHHVTVVDITQKGGFYRTRRPVKLAA